VLRDPCSFLHCNDGWEALADGGHAVQWPWPHVNPVELGATSVVGGVGRGRLATPEYVGAGAPRTAPKLAGKGGAANDPLPPGWNDGWLRMPASRLHLQEWHWYDPAGGEWRWHAPDKYHSTGHWDYQQGRTWNDPWQHIYPPN
jgi:hypothetical protein